MFSISLVLRFSSLPAFVVCPEVIHEAGVGRVEGNPVWAHSFRSVSPSAVFHLTWSISSVLEAATWETTSVFALFLLSVFTTISCSLFLGSVCSGGGTDQLALTSSHLVLVDEGILVVRSSACPAVQRPLPDPVV